MKSPSYICGTISENSKKRLHYMFEKSQIYMQHERFKIKGCKIFKTLEVVLYL